MRVIEIAGEKFVVGLEWYTVEKKELSRFLKEKNIKRYVKVVSKSGRYINVGIPKAEVRDRSLFKYPALAPSLATVKNTSWAGIFKIDETTYYHVAVGNDGIILPDGDVVGTKKESTSAYFKNLELLDEWGELISEGTMDDLYNLTLHIKKKYGFNKETLVLLKNFTDEKVLYMISVATIMVIVGLYFAYKKKTQKQNTHLNFAVIKQIQHPMLMTKKTMVATPQELISSCYRAYYNAMLRYVGWSIESATCTPTNITIQLSRISNAPVINMKGLNIISPSQATKIIKPNIQTEQITVGNNSKVINRLNAWSLKWSNVQLIKQLQSGQFTAMGQSNLALGDLERIKNIYATNFTLTNNWKLDFVTKSKSTTMTNISTKHTTAHTANSQRRKNDRKI